MTKSAAIVLLSVLVPQVAHAQGEVLPACADLGRLIGNAMASDPRIGQADAMEKRGQAEVKVAKGAYLPQLSAFNRVGVGDGFQADNELDNRAGLQLSQRLFDFGTTASSRRAAQARFEQSRADAQATRLSVASEVVQRHLAIVRAEARARAGRIMRDYFERRVSQSEEELAAGLLKRSEAAAIRSEAARTAYLVAEEQLQARQQRTSLTTLVGEDVRCIDRRSSDEMLAIAKTSELPALIETALSQSPDLLSSQAEAEAADHDRRREKASHRPTVSVTGTAAYNYGFDGTPARQVNRVGLDISTPIFQGGQLSGKAQATSAQAEAARFALATKRREIIEAVTQSWTRIDGLTEILRLQEETRGAAAIQAEALEAEFGVQLITLTELIEAKNAEFQAELARIDTEYELDLERLRLVGLTNTLLEKR